MKTLSDKEKEILEKLNKKFPSWIILFRGKDEALPIVKKDIESFLSHSLSEIVEATKEAIVPKLGFCQNHEGEPYLVGCQDCDMAKAFNLAVNKMNNRYNEFINPKEKV